ncbi:conserved virulence factor C family protein [Peribacillus deserti]|uniref:Virulence factor n=1 Tax=Peribacillus deserti TaxID=673318 RepID=A0A2N5M234_9BACI|nr:conserved virulence factor C family protein [Peribacillus deserti]PLT28411.1 virulence factor [Peribacillus deserti]
MKIKSIEPTPSPNTMKIILDEELPFGKSNNYKESNTGDAPEIIQQILKVEGVKGVYHVADFLALERNAKFDWRDILQNVRNVFGESDNRAENQGIAAGFGEVAVQVQMFKEIPMQVKLKDAFTEKRFGLPEQFGRALSSAQTEEDNVVLLRKWKDFGTRYGELDEIGKEVVDELVSSYTEARLKELAEIAKNPEKKADIQNKRSKKKLTIEDLNHPEWEYRYRALEAMDDPSVEDIPLLEKALQDEKVSVRRLAVVYLGMIEDKQVLPALYQALKDKTVTVRRTAGDCLSDLGFPEAMNEMAEALTDKNKLVRWRAAMFLYETGDQSVLPALKRAENDPEFEVDLQVRMAIERIENGEEAKGSVWKQMTEARNK